MSKMYYMLEHPRGSYKGHHGLYPTNYGNSEIDIQVQMNKELKKLKEMETNIPKRALMLEKTSDDIPFLPLLPSALWLEIAKYEGGVESSILGQVKDNNDGWCVIS